MRPLSGSIVFFLLAPGTVGGLVPWLLTGWRAGDPVPWWAPVPVSMLGALLLAAGIAVLVYAFGQFALQGKGTPAPSAPPRRLVVRGLYRYVRNPMYVGLVWAVVGQALLLGRPNLLVYAVCVWTVTAAFVRLREEPVLARRFGAQYPAYRRAVRAWWPRLRPWDAAEPSTEQTVGSSHEFG